MIQVSQTGWKDVLCPMKISIIVLRARFVWLDEMCFYGKFVGFVIVCLPQPVF